MGAALLGGAVAAPVIGSLIGSAMASGDQDAARQAMQQAAAIIGSVKVPTPEELKIVLQHLEEQGQLTPLLEDALTQQASVLNNWSPDQNQEAAQNQALRSLQQQGQQGLTATDRAVLNKIRADVAQQVQAQEQSVLQNMAQRGMGGSGQELAARLLAGQQGAQLDSQQGDTLASQAQQKALQAIAGAGQLGGQMEQSQFGREAQIAAAQNAINQFNTQNQQQVANENVALQNQAQAANLASKQRVADTNAGLQNQQTQYNAQVPLQEYQMNMQKAQAQAGQQANLSNMYGQQAQATRNMWGGIGSGVGQGLGTFAQYNQNQDALQAYKDRTAAGKYYEGGMVGYDEGGQVSPSPVPDVDPKKAKEFVKGATESGYQPEKWLKNLKEALDMNQGGQVQVPHNALQQWSGGMTKDMTSGGKVPGKAKIPGDSPKNDTVPAMLSPGEYVMSRSEVKEAKKAKDPAKFVADVLKHMTDTGKIRK